MTHNIAVGNIYNEIKNMKSKFFLFFISIIIISCNTSYLPFESKKEKRQSERLIKKSFKFSSIEYEKIIQDDSISYSLTKSLKDKKVSKDRIKKRLDSFFTKKYDYKQLWMILELDRTFPDMEFEFEKEDGTKRLDFSSVKDFSKFMKALKKRLDTALRIDIKVKKDSLIRMKNKKKQN